MRQALIAAALLLPLCLSAQTIPVNYDESKVAPFTLPDPLTFFDGGKVRNAADWQKRRAEILETFQSEMYGRMPEASPIYTEQFEEGTTLAGYGHRRQVRMFFREDHTGPYIDWLIVTPTMWDGPYKTVLLLNYQGNHTILPDPEIPVTGAWLRNDDEFGVTAHRASEGSRGLYHGPETMRSTYPVDMILARGYAFVTACYGEICPDPDEADFGKEGQDAFARSRGVFELWPAADPSRGDNTTALAAWGWALCRAMDMIEQDPQLDRTRVLLTGSSRLAKAALIAGAFDERFPVVVLNQTGGGGVPPAKRNYGENISTETDSFTHWYCRNYDKYALHEDTMPFDQNLIISCIAPRALFVQGFGSGWFDTKGEWISVSSASKVWKKLHRGGLPDVDWPSEYDTSAIGDHLAYYRRTNDHGIACIDWLLMMDFADNNFNR